jgi:DNA polymerase-3 subunit epsilon
MRQVVLDTETTGLEVSQGHRVIEIGCVELQSRRATGRHFHCYLNPEREVDAGARAVHGLSLADLADKPRFAAVAAEFTEFVSGAELIIHNASFDVAFLDAEFARLKGAEPPRLAILCRVLDTLALARGMHPGQRNSLDALCKRYGIDNSHRELHGALLDARILADVYLAMTGGQSALALDEAPRRAARRQPAAGASGLAAAAIADLPLRIVAATAAERAAHERLQDLLHKESGGNCLWRGKET